MLDECLSTSTRKPCNDNLTLLIVNLHEYLTTFQRQQRVRSQESRSNHAQLETPNKFSQREAEDASSSGFFSAVPSHWSSSSGSHESSHFKASNAFLISPQLSLDSSTNPSPQQHQLDTPKVATLTLHLQTNSSDAFMGDN